VHLLVNIKHLYQDAWCNDKDYQYIKLNMIIHHQHFNLYSWGVRGFLNTAATLGLLYQPQITMNE